MKNFMSMLVIFLALGAGCEQEKVIDSEQLQERNGIAYEVNATEPYTGVVVELFPDGQKEREIHIVNGKQHGLETVWYENGQKRMELNFVNGELNGLATKWYKNGQKRSEANAVNGQ